MTCDTPISHERLRREFHCKCQSKHTVDRLNRQPARLRRAWRLNSLRRSVFDPSSGANYCRFVRYSGGMITGIALANFCLSVHNRAATRASLATTFFSARTANLLLWWKPRNPLRMRRSDASRLNSSVRTSRRGMVATCHSASTPTDMKSSFGISAKRPRSGSTAFRPARISNASFSLGNTKSP